MGRSEPRALCALLGTLGCAFALLGCASPARRRCELEPPKVIARSEGLAFDGIAVASRDAHAAPTYAWSDPSGLFVQRAGEAPRRLGARCRGGLDARESQAALFVGCSRPDEDEVVVLRVADDVRSTRVGGAGRDGRGVALALAGERLQVAFHQGALGDHAIWLAALDAPARRLSEPGQAAFEPSIAVHAGHVYVAFAELSLRADAAPAAVLRLSRDGEPAQRLAAPQAFSPTPKLTVDARGLLLGYRDGVATRRGRNQLRVMRLDAQGRATGEPTSIGRANADGEPSLYGCGSLTVALLPREYGGERYVGIHALDDELAALGAGHQLYESGRDFVLAAGSCGERGLNLFAADRAAPSAPSVEAVALRFRCAD